MSDLKTNYLKLQPVGVFKLLIQCIIIFICLVHKHCITKNLIKFISILDNNYVFVLVHYNLLCLKITFFTLLLLFSKNDMVLFLLSVCANSVGLLV